MRFDRIRSAGVACALAGLAGLSACGGSDASPAQPPAFRGLGVLDGKVSSVAFGLSRDGTAVVGSSYDSQNLGEAFLWTAASGLQGLGSLPDRPNSEAYGASNQGEVVAGTSVFIDLFDAFRWSAADGIQPLAVAQGDPPPETANAVSNDGSILVGAANFAFADPVAFLWTASGGLEQLGFLSGSSGASEAFGISGDGTVIVGQSTLDETVVAFRWTRAGGMVALPRPAEAIATTAFAVSEDGAVVVGSANTSTHNFKAIRWQADGTPAYLGDLAGGEQTNVARAASADGALIVGQVTFDADGRQAAFLWNATSGMRNLQDVLVKAGLGSDLQGWSLENATGISADGNTIAGTGTDPDGAMQAFVVTFQ